MKRVNYWLVCFMAATAMATTFTACSSDDDPVYNPPTVTTETANGNIDLGDALTFNLPVNIASEAGLASVVVKDAEGNEWLNQTSFTNPNSVNSLTLDLSACTETKLLLLTVTATAKDGKVTSSTQPYSLSVYVPQLYVAMSNVSTITQNAKMDITIGRGVKALAKARVFLNNTQVEELDLTSNAKDKKIFKSINLTGLQDGANQIKVEVFEEGASAASLTEENKAVKVDMSKIMALWINDQAYGFEVRRDTKTGHVKFVSFSKEPVFSENYEEIIEQGAKYYWNMKYNEDNDLIAEIDYTLDDLNGSGEVTQHIYKFTYNTFNELTKVTCDDKDYATDIVYQNGEIASYTINNKKYEPKYAEANGIRTRVDCLDADMTGATFGFKGTETPNPYYIPELPAIIPGDVAGVPVQLCYSQYLFSSLGTSWTSGWVAGTVFDEYPTSKATVTRKDGKEWSFMIIYNNE